MREQMGRKMGNNGGSMDKKREVEPWRVLSGHILWRGAIDGEVGGSRQ
jgi:hypothetical protein